VKAVSSRIMGDLLRVLNEKEMKAINDETELIHVVKKIIMNNPQPVADYKNGKQKLSVF